MAEEETLQQSKLREAVDKKEEEKAAEPEKKEEQPK